MIEFRWPIKRHSRRSSLPDRPMTEELHRSSLSDRPTTEELQFRRQEVEGKSTGRILFFSGLFSALAIGSLPFFVVYLTKRNAAYTDVLFPLLLVAGVVALVLVIAVLVGLFQKMGLTDDRYALALPSGSISAIIALMLILVFAMLSVLVQVNIGYEIRTIGNLSAQQADQIPLAEVAGRQCPTPDNCTIDRKIEKSPAAVDIGKQLVTTVSTLVVAISAFYFGSVQTATAAQRITERSSDRGQSGNTSKGDDSGGTSAPGSGALGESSKGDESEGASPPGSSKGGESAGTAPPGPGKAGS